MYSCYRTGDDMYVKSWVNYVLVQRNMLIWVTVIFYIKLDQLSVIKRGVKIGLNEKK